MNDEASEQPARADQTVSTQDAPKAPARLRKKDQNRRHGQAARDVRSKVEDKQEQAKHATHGEPSGGGGAEWH